MKTKIIFILTFFSCCYGSLEELKIEIIAKQEKLALLGKRISEQEEVIDFVTKKLTELSDVMRERKKEEMTAANTGKKISSQDAHKALTEELETFQRASFDMINKKELYILGNTFFGYTKKISDKASLFKFYVIRHTMELKLLNDFIEQWEILKDEIFRLDTQLIETIKLLPNN